MIPLYNRFLADRTVRDIEKRVSKLLKDLDNPEPPIRLEVVRELLRLDLAYYSSSDNGVLAETIHRLRVAGKQVVERPSLLRDVVKKWDLKALWIPDRKRILVDKDLPSPKKRWGEAHEIGHSILPWHEAAMHGDKTQTLNQACEDQIEAEANFTAGRILFPQDRFSTRLRDSPLSFHTVKTLSREFANSLTSTLWRTVESSETPVFGLVSQHPNHMLKDSPIRYFVRSRSFVERFNGVTDMQVFMGLGNFCRGRSEPIGKDEINLHDTNGDEHVVLVESFLMVTMPLH